MLIDVVLNTNLVFLKQNHFGTIKFKFDLKNWLNFKKALFLTARHYIYLQDIKISFEVVDLCKTITSFGYPSKKLNNPTDHKTYIYEQKQVDHSSFERKKSVNENLLGFWMCFRHNIPLLNLAR